MKRESEIVLPSEVLRNQYYYRSPNPQSLLGELGCGFYYRTDMSCPRSVTTPDSFGFIYLLRGRGKVSVGGGTFRRVRAGDAIQVPPSTSLIVKPDQTVEWNEAFVTIDASLIRRIALINGLDLEKPVLRIGLDLILIRQFQQIASELERATPMSLQGALAKSIELILTILQLHRRNRAEGDEALIGKACRILEDNLAERLDMASVAAKLGIGYHHFRRVFRKQLGLSPAQYRISCRLRMARSMLMHEHKTLAQVASELGYADPFIFSKQFKKGTGHPPSEFFGKPGGARQA